ncbi:MmgE/PrpD family protein [Nocardia sp. CA2R105]|uniref:MmgE/PrpD family protein n=1 Tax=Nocardia coffeae TaxID=2873381 RepID=UPI001CA6A42D|nr:MmgE/PrpD family protein [Nocardia coffeae]MBY8863611.1 MmgE/PrpD family protein [Nocardia coffeae]
MSTGAGVVEVLATQAVEHRERMLEPEVQRWARRAFIDWLGVCLGGSTGLPAQSLLAGLTPASGSSRVVGTGERLAAPVAAMINGAAAHTLELDDIYAPGLYHPGAPTVAAAFAEADRTDASFGRLLRAIAVGYEVGCRVAADLGPAHYAHWHTTGTAGALGSAAAAADLHDADADALANALSLAATMCGGLQQTFRSDAAGKPMHAGAAAQAGVVAAAAARGGLSGALDVLEGPAGLAVATGADTDWATCRAGWNEAPVLERITVKPYQCCGHAFAPIDGALALRAHVQGHEVQEIVVETYSTAVAVAGIAEPVSLAERRFSIPHLVAAALTHDSAARFEPGVEADEKLLAVARRVRLTAVPEFDERFPARRGARVAVVVDGERYVVDVPDRSGSPEKPLDDEQLGAKFVSASGRKSRADDLLAQLGAAAADTPVRELDLA